MTVKADWVEHLWGVPDFDSLETFEVEGVEFDMPVPGQTGTKQRYLQWQRRILEDVLPDSPNADAAERIPLQIIRQLTTATKAKRKYKEALIESERFSPLAPIFLFSTRGKTKVPVAFHVVSSKAADQTVKSRAFTEQTFKLLMRSRSGTLRTDLVERFIDRFRAPPEKLDLAQRTVLKLLHPGWTPNEHTLTQSEKESIEPFVPTAGELLQRDIETLLSASLSSADFFRYTNQLLALHLGLYQPRLAAHLNPAMDLLLSELEQEGSVDVGQAETIERGVHHRYRFEGSLSARAPSGGEWRPVRSDSRVRRDFQAMEDGLVELHFNLMLLHRLRELTRSYLRANDYDESAAESLSRKPSQMIKRLKDAPLFRRFLLRSTEALAVRFAYNQLSEESRESCREMILKAPTGLHALKNLYIRYNLDTSTKPTNSRAYKQGAQVTRSLLSQGEMGLVQSRRGVGTYFEIGAGILPAFLLLIVGANREKVTVASFFQGLSEYGLRMDEVERNRLLSRLKAMGLYERFSDAGEASYVRGLITPKLEEAHP